MKTHPKAKKRSFRTALKGMTLGDLITSTYATCGKRGTAKLLSLAMQTGVITYLHPRHVGF